MKERRENIKSVYIWFLRGKLDVKYIVADKWYRCYAKYESSGVPIEGFVSWKVDIGTFFTKYCCCWKWK